MELRQLSYFREVARREHVSEAARGMNVSQPTVTRQMQELERELGVELFAQAGRRIKLTAAGQALLRHAEIILRQVELARHELEGFGEEIGGRVSIGAPPSVGERLLPGALHEFHDAYPRVELRVSEGSTSTLVRLLGTGELDLAVVSLPVTQPGIARWPLFEEELVLVVAEGHPLAEQASVAIGELSEERFLLYSPGGFVREATLSACRAGGFTPRVALDAGSIELLLCLAEAGLGVAIVPPLAVTARHQLRQLRLSDQRLRRTMGLVATTERPLTKAAVRLRDHLLERIPARIAPAPGSETAAP